MSLTTQYAIRIAAPAASGPLSRVRKQFNALVDKLEAERAKLALWREELPKIYALAASEYEPLTETFEAQRRCLLLLLDQAHGDKTMGKKNKEKLADLICSIAVDLMQADQQDDAVKAIYNKYSGGDFDLEQEAEKKFMIRVAAAMTGIEPDDDTDLSSPRAFFEAMHEQMEQRVVQEQQQRHEQAAAAKPSAREKRHQAEELRLKQSVRDIFRKLASTLHPDRETDPAERERKTGLMQRANVAYAANDLLGLLELQLEVDQINQAGLDNLDDDRIKQYNRILDGQVNEIRVEIRALETALSFEMGEEPGRRRTPKAVMQALRADIAAMRASVKDIAADLDAFTDLKQLKAWLSDYRIVTSATGYDDAWR